MYRVHMLVTTRAYSECHMLRYGNDCLSLLLYNFFEQYMNFTVDVCCALPDTAAAMHRRPRFRCGNY
jgi:hypothetical protein